MKGEKEREGTEQKVAKKEGREGGREEGTHEREIGGKRKERKTGK